MKEEICFGFPLGINNNLLINYGTGHDVFYFPVSYTAYYSCTAMLIDNGGNYSCRITTASTNTVAHINKGGSTNNFVIIAIGY